ncbi:MAG: ROK family protein [Candidatus Rehaiarchaeum fermentans]|nr:ROK family protein [Candidatus Rehaiarchaeum fermentans]
MKFSLFDVGGTYIRYSYSDSRKIGKIIKENVNDVISQIKNRIKGNEDRVVISFAGQIDRINNKILFGPNNKVKNFSLKINNLILVRDTTSSLIAESYKRKEQNIVYLTISTGIGCSAKINGKIMFGKDGNFGEIGHSVINFDGNEKCTCGKENHVEAYVGGKKLEEIAEREGLKIEKLLKNENIVKKYDLLNIYASLFANLINLYDPELVILGGSVYLNNKGFFKKAIILSKNYTVNRFPKFVDAKIKENGIVGAWLIAKNPDILN